MSPYDKRKLQTKIQIETNVNVYIKIQIETNFNLRPKFKACLKIDQTKSQKRSNSNSRQSIDNCKVSKNKLFCPAQAGSLIMRNMCWTCNHFGKRFECKRERYEISEVLVFFVDWTLSYWERRGQHFRDSLGCNQGSFFLTSMLHY